MHAISHSPGRDREHATQLSAAKDADGFSGFDAHSKSNANREGAKGAKENAKNQFLDFFASVFAIFAPSRVHFL
jgi:hypothetical protein